MSIVYKVFNCACVFSSYLNSVTMLFCLQIGLEPRTSTSRQCWSLDPGLTGTGWTDTALSSTSTGGVVPTNIAFQATVYCSYAISLLWLFYAMYRKGLNVKKSFCVIIFQKRKAVKVAMYILLKGILNQIDDSALIKHSSYYYQYHTTSGLFLEAFRCCQYRLLLFRYNTQILSGSSNFLCL